MNDKEKKDKLANALASKLPDFEIDISKGSDLAEDVRVPELGKIEELTDAILMLFQDIEEKLTRYLVSCKEDEKNEMHGQMKRFLVKINSNDLLPLSFRLRVLHTFGKEASFLDAGLTQAILNAYKVAIKHLLDAAAGRETYLLALAKMCGEAITLGTRVTRLNLAAYREPSIMVTRQVHELMRLGYGALANVPASATEQKYHRNIHHGLVWYELMRDADFFRLTENGQRKVFGSLEPYIRRVKAMYIPKQQSIVANSEDMYLCSLVGSRDSRPSWSKGLSPVDDRDRVVLNITALMPILQRQMIDVERHLHDENRQREDLRTEKDIYLTQMVTRHLMRCLRVIPRKYDRQPGNWETVSMVTNIHEALQMPNRSSFTLRPVGADNEENPRISHWSLVNLSPGGMCSECEERNYLPDVSNLVRLVWSNPKLKYPFWAQVRWRRQYLKGGHTQVGLLFLPTHLALWWIQTLGVSDEEGNRFPVLGMKMKDGARALVWTAKTEVLAGNLLIVNMGGKPYVSKVLGIVQQGENFRSLQIQILRRFVLGSDIELANESDGKK
ncbi:MAG: hypothetical protein R8L53_06160 [Mariprofundales bacterium]